MKEGVARSYEGLFGNRFLKDDILKTKLSSIVLILFVFS